MSTGKPTTVAAVDAGALERAALGAIAGAATVAELDEARVRYLGRKSELKLALRDVRDRETGMALNALGARFEGGRGASPGPSSGRPSTRSSTRRSPAPSCTAGRLHLLTQSRRRIEDIFIGMGYTVYDGREVDTVYYNFEALNTPEAHPSRDPRDTFYVDDDTLLRTHVAVADPGDARAGASDLHRLARARVPARHRRRHPTRRSSTRSRRSWSTATSRSPTCAGRSRPSRARSSAGSGGCACGRASSRSRSRRSSSTSPASCATGRAARSASGRVGRAGRRRRGRPRTCSRPSATTPSSGRASRSGSGSTASRGAPRRARPAPVLGQRHPLPVSVLIRVPVSWLREYVEFDLPVEARARSCSRAARSTGSSGARSPAATENLEHFLVGKVLEASKHRTPTGSSSARSTWARARRARSSAVRGTSARARRWPSRSRALLPGADAPLTEAKLRGEVSRGMILSEREARARRRPQHPRPRRGAAGHAARGRPPARRRRPRDRDGLQPAGPGRASTGSRARSPR